ncbi:membrane protein [Bacteroidales bacterium]|nr:membrane protein [Bacteroidales bacterium]
MKKYILICAIAFLAFACNDLFDKTNLESMGSDIVWKDPQLIEAYVNNLYANHPSWTRVESDCSDESRNGYRTHPAWKIIKGEWGVDDNPLGWWSAYTYIRKCNDIIKNIENAPIDINLKNRIKGEAHYFRATAYFYLAVRYGGVPIITEPQEFNSPDLRPGRKSIPETFEFVSSEFAKSAELLVNFKTYDSKNFGRVTWGAAKSMEARTYLFWASPLYNIENKTDLWEKSAKLSSEVITSGTYTLNKNVRNLFLDHSSSENIFAIYYKMPERQHGLDAWAKPVTIANGDAAHWGPLQELVDAFPTINGLSIDQDQTYDPANPYLNRDPRLQAFICVNGSQYCGRTQYNYMDIGTVDPSFPAEELMRFKSWDVKGGEQFDAAGSPHNSLTGYIYRKGIKEDLAINAYSYGNGSETPFIEIRLAEVILNLAEALNEMGESELACNELFKIRDRAGILSPEVPAKNRQSKEALRKFIQNERYIELCFEHKRYWDLRRWKLAESLLGGRKFKGAKILLNLLENADILASQAYKTGSFTQQLDMLRKTWTYQTYEVDEAPYVFEAKMYFMPIPRSELETNPNLNNPGW